MIRTVVYRDGETPLADDPRPRRRQKAKDGYLERLVKYVPAEVTAVFAVLAVAADSVKGDWLLWIVVIAGFAVTPMYLWGRARALPPLKRPLPFFYVLATVAFGFWALGVSGSVRELIDVGDTVAEVLLGLAALLIPAVDMVLSGIFSADDSRAA